MGKSYKQHLWIVPFKHKGIIPKVKWAKMGWIHIPDLFSSVLQDPSGRSGGGKNLPKELLPPLSLQTWHVESTEDAQTHVILSHTCPLHHDYSRRGYSHCNQSTLQLDRDSPLLNSKTCWLMEMVGPWSLSPAKEILLMRKTVYFSLSTVDRFDRWYCIWQDWLAARNTHVLKRNDSSHSKDACTQVYSTIKISYEHESYSQRKNGFDRDETVCT